MESSMAERNGECSVNASKRIKMDDGGDGERTEDYEKLLEYGLHEKVAIKIDDIFKSGKLAHAQLDERVFITLKGMSVVDAEAMLQYFLELNTQYIPNKIGYLKGALQIYIQNGYQIPQAIRGFADDKIIKILERTGYPYKITIGQRQYGGPPPNWDGPPPGKGCEIYCGKIPYFIMEDELIPLLEKCGQIWELRLIIDPMTGNNSGYAFATFTTVESAANAVQQLHNYEISYGKYLKVNINNPNVRLFVANIPKCKDKNQILEEFRKISPDLMDVIVCHSFNENEKNRGFCFLEYGSHKAASQAKRRLSTSMIAAWKCYITADWAEPQDEPDEEIMSKIKVVFVKNIPEEVTEDYLLHEFMQYGKIVFVKKIKNYAFVHFEDRNSAIIAINEHNGKQMGSSILEVSLAKPPPDKNKKQDFLLARSFRMMPEQANHAGNTYPMRPNMMPLPPGPGMPLPPGPGMPLPLGPGMPLPPGPGMQPRAPMGEFGYDNPQYGYDNPQYGGGNNVRYFDDCGNYDGSYYIQQQQAARPIMPGDIWRVGAAPSGRIAPPGNNQRPWDTQYRN